MLVRVETPLRNHTSSKHLSTANDDKSASIAVPDGENAFWIGWPAVVERLQLAITERCSSKPILVVECYPGVDAGALFQELQQRLKPALALNASTAFHPAKRIEKLVQPYVDESNPLRAQSHTLTLLEFFDAERLWHARREIEDLRDGLVLIVGSGASLIAWGHVLVYANLTRSEARSRLSRQGCANLGLENQALATEEKLRIASHVDWPVADRWKRPLITHWDFVLDTNSVETPRLFDGEAVQRGLQLAVLRPFCFAPRSLENSRNPSWREENLLLSFGNAKLEMPALDLIMTQPRSLLGDAAFLRLGFDCPLPFNTQELVASPAEPLHNGDGWSEERVIPTEKADLIETIRLQFTRGVPQHTNGSMLVLELVDGPKVSVESPKEAFAPLVFHRGQMFIVPAAVGEFILRPAGLTQGLPWTVLKAFVQTVTTVA